MIVLFWFTKAMSNIRIYAFFVALFLSMPFNTWYTWLLSCRGWPSCFLWSAIVSKLWHDIRAVFPTYTCNHSCYTIYMRFFVTYTCVLFCFVGFLFPSIWPFSYKRAYICAQKSPYICVTNKHVVYGVTESRRIRGTELYRQQKTPSCTMELKSNFSLNQAWPQWPR